MFAQWLRIFLAGLGELAIVTAALLILETLFPRGTLTLVGRLRGLTMVVIYALLGTALGAFIPRSGTPLVHLGHAAWWTLPLSLLVYDFLYYWMHRLQHRWLWRLHAVHHSIEEMSAISAYHYPTEQPINFLLVSWPMWLLFGWPGATIPALIMLLYGNYLHAATRVNFGPLRWLFVDNVYHRVHHSVEPEHWNKNFAVIFPLWDRIFGTLHMPASDEWPATGVPGRPEPQDAIGFLLHPLRPGIIDAHRD